LYVLEDNVITVTIDTNVLIRGLDGSEEERKDFEYLRMMHKQRIIDVAVTNRFLYDKRTDPNPERAARHIEAAKEFTEIISPYRWDDSMSLSKLGFIAEDSMSAFMDALFNVTQDERERSMNQSFDTDHLYGHLVAKRDYFLTNEKKIYRKRPILLRFGINIAQSNIFVDGAEYVNPDALVFDETMIANLEIWIEKKMNIRLDPVYTRKVNKLIGVLEIEQEQEMKKREYDRQARDADTLVGYVIAVLVNIFENRPGVGATFLAAKHAYPRLKEEYEKNGSKYGDDHLGLIKWIKEKYEVRED
jgi:hypothetical protein